jgi:N-acetylglucosamine-6-phosphate deacetylase
MTSLAIRSGTLDVTVLGSRIAAVGPSETQQADQVVDAAGCSVLPGFIDLQVNGAIGVDLTSRPEGIGDVAAFFVECGVTSFMPTVISSSATDIARAIQVMGRWTHGPDAARSLGLHLEGPFLNPQRAGAHPKHQLREPSVAEVQSWTSDAGVGMVTIAPELPHALEVIELLAANGVTVCAGHTAADASAMSAGIDAGVRGVTHLFNAMGPISARVPGPAVTTLTDPGLIAGLIVDGIHVDPAMVRLAWRALGPNQIMLVTDAISALGLPYGAYAVGDTAVVVDDRGARTAGDVLAGSVLRFDQAVRNLIKFTGCTLADASIAASATPARLVGRDDIGRIAPGCIADLVLLDESNHVVVTVVDGQVAYDPQHRCTQL